LFFGSIVGDFVARPMRRRYAPARSTGNHEASPEITKSVKHSWSRRAKPFRAVTCMSRRCRACIVCAATTRTFPENGPGCDDPRVL